MSCSDPVEGGTGTVDLYYFQISGMSVPHEVVQGTGRVCQFTMPTGAKVRHVSVLYGAELSSDCSQAIDFDADD